jgi:hypothetical protein
LNFKFVMNCGERERERDGWERSVLLIFHRQMKNNRKIAVLQSETSCLCVLSSELGVGGVGEGNI